MRILLDSHAFIWWDDELKKLSRVALAACQDEENTLVLSLVSVWEMQIKIQLGKLNFSVALKDKIAHQQAENGLELLPITLDHILGLAKVPFHHNDPFDRLLIAQAIYEDMPIVTHDAWYKNYPVKIIW